MTFKKISKKNSKMYGKYKVLVCGFNKIEKNEFIKLIKTFKVKPPIVFVGSNDTELKIVDLLLKNDGYGFEETSEMPKAVIMSGFYESQLHELLRLYKETNLERPLWASVTPISENWKLKDLLSELQSEHDMMKEMQKK